MLRRFPFLYVTVLALISSTSHGWSASPNGVKTLDPPGAIKAEGTWSLGARAGDFIFVAGMQGIDPATNTLVKDPQARIRRASSTKYKFKSNLRGAKFQCGVGRRPRFRACSSPVRVVGIKRGSKTTFQVRAVNGKAKDKSPAKDSFRRP